jgi:Tol biopolymer transport system component
MLRATLMHFIILGICLIQGCVSTTEKETSNLQKPFFGIVPTDTLQLVAPGVVSSNLAEYNGTFSPDGTEFYYTVTFPGRSVISFMKLNPDDRWSDPIIAGFSGEYSDVDPIFSPDGTRLFFTSFRPTDDSGKNGRTNIWYVDRVGNDWSSPNYISLSENGDYYSSCTTSGVIYFNTWKTGDIYKAVKTDSGYSTEKITDIINTDKAEGDPFISPDESYLIFRGYNQEGSFGGGDLYISFNINNQWTKAENLGEAINSPEDEICPLVTADGKLFIFSSNRYIKEFKPASLESLKAYKHRFNSPDNGAYNIFSISADFIEEMRKKY